MAGPQGLGDINDWKLDTPSAGPQQQQPAVNDWVPDQQPDGQPYQDDPSWLQKYDEMWINQPLWQGPTRFADMFAEPMMQYGESGPKDQSESFLRTPALYAGAFLHNVGEGVSGLTSPLNLASMGAGTMASQMSRGALALNAAGKVGAANKALGVAKNFNRLDKALVAPQIAAGGARFFKGIRQGEDPETKELDWGNVGWTDVGTGLIEGLTGYWGAKAKIPGAFGDVAPPVPRTTPGGPVPPSGPAVPNVDPNFNQGVGDPNLAGTTPYQRGPGTVPPQAQSPTGPDLSGSVQGGRIKLHTLPDGATVATVMRPEAEVPYLRQNGYVPWVDHRSADGWPQMIRHPEPLPSGEAPPVQPGQPPPVQPAQVQAAGGNSVSINADGTAMVPRASLSTLIINRLKEQGMEMFGRDSEGNGFFRQIAKDEEGSFDPNMYNPMAWRRMLSGEEPQGEGLQSLARMFRSLREQEAQAPVGQPSGTTGPITPVGQPTIGTRLREARERAAGTQQSLPATGMAPPSQGAPRNLPQGPIPTEIPQGRNFNADRQAIASANSNTHLLEDIESYRSLQSEAQQEGRWGEAEYFGWMSRYAGNTYDDLFGQAAPRPGATSTINPTRPSGTAIPPEVERNRGTHEGRILGMLRPSSLEMSVNNWHDALENYTASGDVGRAQFAREMMELAQDRLDEVRGQMAQASAPRTSARRQTLERYRQADENSIDTASDAAVLETIVHDWARQAERYTNEGDHDAATYAAELSQRADERLMDVQNATMASEMPTLVGAQPAPPISAAARTSLDQHLGQLETALFNRHGLGGEADISEDIFNEILDRVRTETDPDTIRANVDRLRAVHENEMVNGQGMARDLEMYSDLIQAADARLADLNYGQVAQPAPATGAVDPRVEAGQLTAEEAAANPLSGNITNAITEHFNTAPQNDISGIRPRMMLGQQELPGVNDVSNPPFERPPAELERLVNAELARRRNAQFQDEKFPDPNVPPDPRFVDPRVRQSGLLPVQGENIAGEKVHIRDLARKLANLPQETVQNFIKTLGGKQRPAKGIHKKGSSTRSSWDRYADEELARVPPDPSKPGLTVDYKNGWDYIYRVEYRDKDGTPLAYARISKDSRLGTLGIPSLGAERATHITDQHARERLQAKSGLAAIEVLTKSLELGATGTGGSISDNTAQLIYKALDRIHEGREHMFDPSRPPVWPKTTVELPDKLSPADRWLAMTGEQPPESAGIGRSDYSLEQARAFARRLMSDESGEAMVESSLLGPLGPMAAAAGEAGRAIGNLKSAIGQRWSSAMSELDARKAPDEEYQSLMPNSARPLGRTETWRERVQKGIDFFEKKAAQEGVSQASATAPPTATRGAAPFTEAQLQQAFIAAGIPPGGRPPGKGGGGGLPGGKTPWFDKSLGKKPEERSYLRQLYDFTRGGTTTGDLSAPFRQGLPLMFTKAWRDSWGTMMSSLGSEDAFKKTLSDIRERPMFKREIDLDTGKVRKSFAEQAGLELMDVQGRLSRREESLASNWVESGEMFGKDNAAQKLYKGTAGRYARATNRAYVSFLNQLRADTFESLMKDAEEAFKADTKAGNKGAKNPHTDLTFAKEIADFVNTASGRGPLRMQLPHLAGPSKWGTANIMGQDVKMPFKEQSAERAAHILTESLFSPRLVASRMRMLNPATYMMASPFVRKQYLKAAAHTSLAWLGMAGAAYIAGAEVELDTQSADFGKIKIGNTRLDPAGGFQQYIVAFSRMIQGGYQSSSSGQEFEYGQGYRAETRGDALQRFGVNKLHPVLKFGNDILFASTRQPFNVADRTAQLFVPLIAQDMLELAQEDPALLPLVGAMFVGMGSQTYDKGENEGKFLPPDYDWTFTGGSPSREFNNLPFFRE